MLARQAGPGLLASFVKSLRLIALSLIAPPGAAPPRRIAGSPGPRGPLPGREATFFAIHYLEKIY